MNARQKARNKMVDIMYKLRIWLAYFIMPKDTRKYLLQALSYNIKELERETTELFNQMNAESQESEDK